MLRFLEWTAESLLVCLKCDESRWFHSYYTTDIPTFKWL